MPLLGFGVYQNYVAAKTCLEAFKAGYRYVFIEVFAKNLNVIANSEPSFIFLYQLFCYYVLIMFFGFF